jgi:TRAP-type C4-dicarboxylate transport system substrate-binding protein
VDGQENTISNIYSKRLYQVQKYMTVSNHGYLGYAVIINKSFWEKLPPDVQRVLTEALEEATAYSDQIAVSMNEQQWKQLTKESSMEIHVLTPQEQAVWREALQPVYKSFAPMIGSALMDEISKLHRQQ